MGYLSTDENDNGNRYISFNHQKGYIDMPVFLPCQKCRGCRLEYGRIWALRCMNEAELYEENCFVTLTYNNENLPTDKGLKKSDVQKFLKRLRKKYEGKIIRYFGCGEYGEKGRPHYHLIIFNYKPEDLDLIKSQRYSWKRSHFSTYKGGDLFTSEEIAELWQKGFVSVGEVTFESCGYCARYALKKVKGEKAKEKYGEKEPPYSMMSRRPGIGREWIEKYLNDIYAKDYLNMNGKRLRPCRYYDNILKDVNPERYKQLKRKRYKELERFPDRRELMRKEKYKKLQTKNLKRSGTDENVFD